MKALSFIAVTSLAMTILSPHALLRAAEVRVLSTGAIGAALNELRPRFETASGHKLDIQYALPPALLAKIGAGEPFDVVILSLDVEGLIKQGKVTAVSRTVLGRTGVGVAIRQGAPKPDFGNADSFKRALLGAKSIATTGEGSSGRYVLTLLDRLGIANEVKPKIKSGESGSVPQLLTSGAVDFAVVGLPPVANAPGVEWLGWLPTELNSWVVFTGGVGSAAKEAKAGQALLDFLTTPDAVAVFKAKGLDPAPR
jgi:molybdate transport system substrate-binding protein